MKLKELGTIVTGNTPSKQSVENWDSPDIGFVKPDIISDTGISIIDDAAEYISEKARAKARIVGENSILITCIGSIGKIGITAKGTFAFNQQINAIIPNRKVNSKYLAYALLYAKPRLVAIANAPVVPIINKSQFGDFEIKVTENTEYQSKAVEVLDTVNAIIENRRQQLQKLDELVKARFVELFGDPISNPMNWNKRTLKEVCTKLNDGTHFSPESFSMGDYKYITAKNIKASGFDFSNITYVPEAVHRPIFERCNPEQGDVLYIKDGATTGIAIVNTLKEEFTLLSSVALLKQNRNVINGYFLAALLNNADMYSDIRNNMGGAAITRLTIAKLNAVKVIVPPLDLQNRFAAFVHQVDKSKVAVQKSLNEAQLLFDSLMQQYFG